MTAISYFIIMAVMVAIGTWLDLAKNTTAPPPMPRTFIPPHPYRDSDSSGARVASYEEEEVLWYPAFCDVGKLWIGTGLSGTSGTQLLPPLSPDLAERLSKEPDIRIAVIVRRRSKIHSAD